MTHKSAIKLLEGYYGAYERDLTKGMIYDYLQGEFTEDELEIIMDRIVKGYTGQFRFTPDIHIIEKFKTEYNDEQDGLVGGVRIGGRRQRLRIIESEERPDDEQKAEVADMLTGLSHKLGSALVENETDPYDDEILVDR